MSAAAEWNWSGSIFNLLDSSQWGQGHLDWDGFNAWAMENPDAFWGPSLTMMSEAGVRAVDLAMNGSGWQGASRWAGGGAGFGRRLADHGLTISASYQSGHPVGDAVGDADAESRVADGVAEHARFVAAAGGDLMLIGSPLRRDVEDYDARLYEWYTRLARLAAAEGVRLAVHTEGYAKWTSPDEIRGLLAATPTELFLCPDVGHITLQGDDAVRVISDSFDRIASMHVKDSRHSLPAPEGIDPDEAEARMGREFCMPSEGVADWPSIVGVLRERGYTGWLVAEVDDAADPVRDTRAIMNHIEAL